MSHKSASCRGTSYTMSLLVAIMGQVSLTIENIISMVLLLTLRLWKRENNNYCIVYCKRYRFIKPIAEDTQAPQTAISSSPTYLCVIQ